MRKKFSKHSSTERGSLLSATAARLALECCLVDLRGVFLVASIMLLAAFGHNLVWDGLQLEEKEH